MRFLILWIHANDIKIQVALNYFYLFDFNNIQNTYINNMVKVLLFNIKGQEKCLF